jgi:hypothetical protein
VNGGYRVGTESSANGVREVRRLCCVRPEWRARKESPSVDQVISFHNGLHVIINHCVAWYLVHVFAV